MYKFLLIEDSNTDYESFQTTVERLNLQANEELYQLGIAKTYEEGMEMLSGNLNGIIVDIKLDKPHSGNEIIKEIIKKFRVPVAIFTGTPDVTQDDNSPIKVYKKGEARHEDIINDLRAIFDTGLFNVLGGTGIIENTMIKIFWYNLYPQIELWRTKKQQGIDTEKILLRYAVSHIQELIDNEIPEHVTEEMYISPTLDAEIRTGAIIKSNTDNSYYIVLSPPCDLAIYDGKPKTDCILICEIEPLDKVNEKLIKGIKKTDKKKEKIIQALKNTHSNYYHWLPKNTLFEGGYINFRKVITYSPNELHEKYHHTYIKVQEKFVKNILNRFSSYYARQGQPDFDFNSEAEIIMQMLGEEPNNKS